MRLFIQILLTFSTLASTQIYGESFSCEPAGTIEERLSCIDGLTFSETQSTPTQDRYRVFDLKLVQPVDHNDLNGETFEQRLVLFHRDVTGPVVLQTSGYAIFGKALTQVANLFKANQIQVEHRFFGESVPASKDWKKLDIVQSAADFHRITMALRQVYSGKWINTGASKGGMTSVFYRRFYPDDLDGTLALVAPLSYSTFDNRYIDFVDQAGGSTYTSCRAKLETFQKAVLGSREKILPLIKGEYSVLGSADIALEHAVYELPFAFWQYGNPESATAGCKNIPRANASVTSLVEFLKTVNDVEGSYSDDGMKGFVPYYVQAAHQLGGPAAKLSHLAGLSRHESTYKLESYVPRDAQREFDAEAMPEIQEWVKAKSSKIMFIYGEFDPWSAGAYEIGSEERGNRKFIAPAGNHGSNISHLSESDRREAKNLLTKWLGAKIIFEPHVSLYSNGEETLENIELKALRGLK